MSEPRNVGLKDLNPRSHWGVFLHPLIIVPFLMGLLVALFAPDDIFQRNPLLASYYTAVKDWMPLIEGHARYSEFPDVTRLYLSIAWPLMLIQVIAAVYLENTNRFVLLGGNDEFVKHYRSEKGKLMITRQIGIPIKFWVPFGVVILDVALIAHFFLGRDPSFCTGCANASRVGMFLIWGVFTPFIVYLMTAMQFMWLRNFKKIYFHN